ncbi:MAG: transglutaminase family protein [Clostridiales bacterium]|nr:transglutaminase family protein [Clostridiales bacterium]
MRELHFIYQMSLMFSKPAARHNYTLKCFPQSDEVQKIDGLRILLDPESRNFTSIDSFGNQTLCGEVEQEHRLFRITVEGRAETGLQAGRRARPEELGKYRYPSFYTKAGDQIRAYWRSHPVFGMSPREAALYYMRLLYEEMQYMPGATGVDTKAEEAWTMRRGVCQDYAHILLALLRLEHIPARYVVGMMIGEGASHAWVEVEDSGIWYGVDPTNGREADDQYIFISAGRDAFDCQMNKGMMVGGGQQRQSVSVIVTDVFDNPLR